MSRINLPVSPLNIRLERPLEVISGRSQDVRLGRSPDAQIGYLGDVLTTLEGDVFGTSWRQNLLAGLIQSFHLLKHGSLTKILNH